MARIEATEHNQAPVNPDKLYPSQALPGVTIMWRGGEINCYNLLKQLKQHGLPFVDQIQDIKFRMGSCGLEYYREYQREADPRYLGWRTCENGDNQVYFDKVKEMQTSAPEIKP